MATALYGRLGVPTAINSWQVKGIRCEERTPLGKYLHLLKALKDTGCFFVHSGDLIKSNQFLLLNFGEPTKMASIEEIEKLLKTNNELLRADIKTDINAANKEVLEAIESTLTLHQDQIKNIQEKLKRLEESEYNRAENELQRETRERRNNIILNKIEESEPSQEKLFEGILKLLNEATPENTIEKRDIDYLYRLGKKKNDGSRRPILVRLISLNTKNSILKNFQFFKNKNIEIFEDFPKQIRDRRREIMPIMKILKEKDMKATIRVDKLIVNGELWSLARAQEFVDEPVGEMVVDPEVTVENKSKAASQKRSRSSPTSKSPSQQQRKKHLTLQITKDQANTKVGNTTSPIILPPKLNIPVVTTPTRNTQVTTIIFDK